MNTRTKVLRELEARLQKKRKKYLRQNSLPVVAEVHPQPSKCTPDLQSSRSYHDIQNVKVVLTKLDDNYDTLNEESTLVSEPDRNNLNTSVDNLIKDLESSQSSQISNRSHSRTLQSNSQAGCSNTYPTESSTCGKEINVQMTQVVNVDNPAMGLELPCTVEGAESQMSLNDTNKKNSEGGWGSTFPIDTSNTSDIMTANNDKSDSDSDSQEISTTNHVEMNTLQDPHSAIVSHNSLQVHSNSFAVKPATPAMNSDNDPHKLLFFICFNAFELLDLTDDKVWQQIGLKNEFQHNTWEYYKEHFFNYLVKNIDKTHVPLYFSEYIKRNYGESSNNTSVPAEMSSQRNQCTEKNVDSDIFSSDEDNIAGKPIEQPDPPTTSKTNIGNEISMQHLNSTPPHEKPKNPSHSESGAVSSFGENRNISSPCPKDSDSEDSINTIVSSPRHVTNTMKFFRTQNPSPKNSDSDESTNIVVSSPRYLTKRKKCVSSEESSKYSDSESDEITFIENVCQKQHLPATFNIKKSRESVNISGDSDSDYRSSESQKFTQIQSNKSEELQKIQSNETEEPKLNLSKGEDKFSTRTPTNITAEDSDSDTPVFQNVQPIIRVRDPASLLRKPDSDSEESIGVPHPRPSTSGYKSCPRPSTSGYKSVKRKMIYFYSEKVNMLKYIEKHVTELETIKGNVFWKHMEASGCVKGRTWQSLKNHYFRTLVNELSTFKLDPKFEQRLRRYSRKN